MNIFFIFADMSAEWSEKVLKAWFVKKYLRYLFWFESQSKSISSQV